MGDLYRDEEWLREQYHDKKLSLAKMAELAFCAKTTLRFWMDRYGIKRRSVSQALKLKWKEEDFRREHVIIAQNLSPEHKRAFHEGCLEYWSKVENREKQAVYVRGKWKSKTFQRKVSRGIRRAWKEGAYAYVHYVPTPGSFEAIMWRIRQE